MNGRSFVMSASAPAIPNPKKRIPMLKYEFDHEMFSVLSPGIVPSFLVKFVTTAAPISTSGNVHGVVRDAAIRSDNSMIIIDVLLWITFVAKLKPA